MTKKVVALLDTDEAVNEAVDKLGKQSQDAFDWRLIQFNNESQRLVPIYGAATDLNGSAIAAPGVASGGAVVHQPSVGQAGASIREIGDELGISDDEAQYFAQGLEHGGQIAVIETPDKRVDAACKFLEGLGGQGVMIIDS